MSITVITETVPTPIPVSTKAIAGSGTSAGVTIAALTSGKKIRIHWVHFMAATESEMKIVVNNTTVFETVSAGNGCNMNFGDYPIEGTLASFAATFTVTVVAGNNWGVSIGYTVVDL